MVIMVFGSGKVTLREPDMVMTDGKLSAMSSLAKVQRDRPILGTLSIRRDEAVLANSNRLQQYSSSQQLSSDMRLVTQLHLPRRRCGTLPGASGRRFFDY
jgi:hypothetical protein